MLADRVQLQQVMLNLIMNGIDAMASVKDRTRRLTIKSELQQSRDVLITVQDAGTGNQSGRHGPDLRGVLHHEVERDGLGLSICRSIIEAHGGRLWASAGTPHGSVFHIVLPSAGSQVAK